MKPTEREDAVAKALREYWGTVHKTDGVWSYYELARAAIAALDIDRIEREAYERGVKDIVEVVEQWYDNYCNHVPQADLMRVLAKVMEGVQ